MSSREKSRGSGSTSSASDSIAASICAEIADQHCAQLHVTATAHVISMDGLSTRPARVVRL